MVWMPAVFEQGSRGEKIYDLPSRLMKDRIVLLSEDVNPLTSSVLIMQFLFLDSQDAEKPIHFYINSPGGSVSDGLAIYDTMKLIKAPVYTTCIGMAASMGAFLLSAGEKGFRHALPNSRIMIHQPSGGAGGQSTDIQIQAREIERLRKLIDEILAKNTGKTAEQINKDCERDYYMSATEALKYGLVDKVVEAKSKKK